MGKSFAELCHRLGNRDGEKCILASRQISVQRPLEFYRLFKIVLTVH